MRAGLVAVALLVSACSSPWGTQAAAPARPSALVDAGVYAAIGASETVGIGAAHPERDAWTQDFYRRALPERAIFYNFGQPGATAEDAVSAELPDAVQVRPDLVAVWLNTNDIIHGVAVGDYESRLDAIVKELRRAKARVLVANTPQLDGLPAYRDCLKADQEGSRCLIHGRTPPAPAELDGTIAAYNASIARVAARYGATVVDLNCQGDMATRHPDWVSADGFHPTAQGYRVIASAFEAALAGRSSCSPAAATG